MSEEEDEQRQGEMQSEMADSTKPAVVTQEIHTDDIVNALRPLVQTFFERMNEPQQKMMQSGKQDVAIASLLAEMLLDMITKLSNTMADSLKSCKMSEAQVIAIVRIAIPQTFAEVLDVEQTSNASSGQLADLISKEVIEEASGPRVTSPNRLQRMISHASSMIKAFITCKCLSKGQKKDRETPVEEVPLSTRTLEETRTSEPEYTESVSPDHVQQVISTAVDEMSEPLSEDMTPSDYESVRAGFNEETEHVVEEVFKSMTTSSKSRRQRLSVKVGTTIKAFFAKHFAKVAIHRAVAELRTKYRVSTSRGLSARTMAKRIDALLETKEEEGVIEPSEFKRLRNRITGKSVKFTEDLKQLLSDSVTHSRTTASIKKMSHNIQKDVQSKVKRFFTVMDWWFHMQSDRHKDRVMKDLTGTDPGPPVRTTPPPELRETPLESQPPEPAEKPPERAPEDKVCVILMVHNLVSRSFHKVGLNMLHTRSRQNIVISWLQEEVWKKLEYLDLSVNIKSVKNLDRDIFDDLCNKCGGKENLLGALVNQKADVVQHIVTCLSKPVKKQNAVIRFFKGLC